MATLTLSDLPGEVVSRRQQRARADSRTLRDGELIELVAATERDSH